MAKALKVVAVGLGVAALAVATGGLSLGVSASVLMAGSALTSTASALLTKQPGVPAAQQDRLQANIDPRAFRKTVLGQTAFPVDVRYEEWSGPDQENCDWIVALASHAIDGVEEIWLNTELAWSRTTGVVGKYRGYFSVPNIILEGSPANAFSFATGKWNGAARLTGCAYARLRFKVTGNSKKAESPFASGIPSRITIIGRGAKLYDPRRDSTVPGGSGPMRWDDQSTWRYTADDGAGIGENLPLHILRVVLGSRIQNPATGELKLATGSGVPGRRLNLASWITAANLADEPVNRSAGGTEPRYHGAGVVSEGEAPKAALDALCAASCARFRDTNGKLSIAIAHNDLAQAATDEGLNTDDVIGGFTWDPDPSLADTPNVVRGRYIDASTGSLYQPVDYPEVRLPSPDGQDRILSLDLGYVESASHAQRVVKQALQRRQYPRQFTAAFDIRAWKYTVGDVLPFTFAPLSFDRRVFRVKDQELGQDGVCNMTLSVEHQAIYGWDRDDAAPVQAAEPIVYESRNNPLILAINEAGGTAMWDGVTGPGKPADDATNSADPAAPFGPGGTVGGALDLIGDAKAIADAAKARVETLDTETIPAIDAAVALAGQRIADARGRADQALAELVDEIDRAKFAEGRLDQRISSVSASGGYDDAAVYAEIDRVERAFLDEDLALGQRLDAFQAGYTSGGGNLLSNTEFLTSDGWRLTHNGLDAQMVINAAGDLWHPVGENVLSLFQNGRRGNDGLSEISSRYFAVTPGSHVQCYAFTASHRATAWVSMYFFDAAGTIVGHAGENTGARLGGGGKDPAAYDQTGVKAFPVPATAVTACLLLRKYDTLPEQPDSYAWFWRPYVGVARPGQTSWNAYSPGNGAAVQVATAARITDEVRALSDADRALASRSGALESVASALDATLNAPGGVLSRLASAQDTLADLPNRYAAAQDVDTLEAQVNFAADSGLQRALNARIEDRANAIADAKTGVVAQTVSALRGEYDDTKAEVINQRGVIIDLEGKTTSYVRTTAIAGTNTATASLIATDGFSGFYLDTNIYVLGDAMIAGTIRNATDTVRYHLPSGIQTIVANGYRKVTGAAFGAAGDLMEWWGPNGTAPGAESKSNGLWALATDGKVYFGSPPVGAGGGTSTKAVALDFGGGVGSSGSTEFTVGTASGALPAGGKLKITSAVFSATHTGGNIYVVNLRFKATREGVTTLLATARFSVTPGGEFVDDDLRSLAARLFDSPGDGPVTYTVTASRGGPTGNYGDFSGSAIIEWVNT